MDLEELLLSCYKGPRTELRVTVIGDVTLFPHACGPWEKPAWTLGWLEFLRWHKLEREGWVAHTLGTCPAKVDAKEGSQTWVVPRGTSLNRAPVSGGRHHEKERRRDPHSQGLREEAGAASWDGRGRGRHPASPATSCPEGATGGGKEGGGERGRSTQ